MVERSRRARAAVLSGSLIAGALIGCGPVVQGEFGIGWPQNVVAGVRATVAPSVRIGGEVGVHVPYAFLVGGTARLSVEHVPLDTGGFRLGYGIGGGASYFLLAGCFESDPPRCGSRYAVNGDVFANAEFVTGPVDLSILAGVSGWRFEEPRGWAERKALGEDVMELFRILPMVRLAAFF